VTNFNHGARKVAADDEWKRQRHLHEAATDVSINGIDRDGADFDQALRRAGFRRRQLAEDYIFRRPGLLDIGSFHQ